MNTSNKMANRKKAWGIGIAILILIVTLGSLILPDFNTSRFEKILENPKRGWISVQEALFAASPEELV
ncbi:MAG: hypothetical protein MRZ79_01805 [Bacteroidia bacterium]|nr:hypothetical protein [Bacteroidia bacterium]